MSSIPERADVVIVTPLEEERDAVLSYLPDYQRLMPSEKETRVYYWADIGSCRIAVLPLLGMGRVQGAVATDAAIERWQPQYVVLVGIAGGVAAQSVKLGDVLVADQIVDYELQKTKPEGPDIRYHVYPTDPRLLGVALNLTDKEWQELIKVKRPGGRGTPRRHRGPVASGDKVIAFGEALEQYREVWSKLIGVEMEAGGVAVSALQAGSRPRFFMVRGVSDLADDKKDSKTVERWRPYACGVAAAYTIALLKAAPLRSSPSPAPVQTAPAQTETRAAGESGLRTGSYNLGKIRRLLAEGFSDKELRGFCFETPSFRAVCDELSSGSSRSEIVYQILDYAERRLLIGVLLDWASAHNPSRYQQDFPYR